MDVCAGGDDTVDSDDDGTPDACDDYADDPAKTEQKNQLASLFAACWSGD
ncbi:MAG: hypothetical protein P8J59_04260 [Phycisphaerales bacterium]|jgi:hypothetical protein|nr:hypothetical protein [Phycisphaerales bacterium]